MKFLFVYNENKYENLMRW